MAEILKQCSELKQILQHRAEERHYIDLLKDIDAKRVDLERRTALFVPSKQRLERGGKTLEIGEEYETIKALRLQRGKNKIKQDILRTEMTEARNSLQNAEEALALIETEYRDKLAEQTKLANTVQRVKSLDVQIEDRKNAAVQARNDYDESEKKLRECSMLVENEQTSLEHIELALREAGKFLQMHSIDEKLQAALPGIHKCFNMYTQADEKQSALKSSWAKSIQKKLQAQSVLNDRIAMFSETNHRYSVIEKNYVRAKSFYEGTLKGKSIAEWHEICDNSVKRLGELDELYRKFQEIRSLEERLQNILDTKSRIQQETRSLNIRDVARSGKIHELQQEAARLEKRSSLLKRIEDLDAVRELLQDGAPCPLCGSMTHPYTSGAVIPDPEEVHRQLSQTQKELENLNTELSLRQEKAGQLSDEITSVSRDESDIRKQINELTSEAASRISLLGLKFSANMKSLIAPFEDLDRERQKTRDTLQLARNATDTAESAQRDAKAAADELDKIRETLEEVTRYHQEALFSFQNAKTEEEQLNAECKSHAEILESLKRELISQITPYGYKTLPDKNPSRIIETLENRKNEWHENLKKRDELERSLSLAGTKMSSLKKRKESLRLERDEMMGRMKAVEAERDTIQQQRVIIFASMNPDDEMSRMNKDVETLREQLNEKRGEKNEKAQKLDGILTSVHSLETEMSKGREELQRHEIAFNKSLLSLGFRNEEDYSASCLTADERRDLQNRLRELTQSDLDLKSERENTRAKILELQSEGMNMTDDEINAKIRELKDSLTDEDRSEYADTIDEIKNLILSCGLEEVF